MSKPAVPFLVGIKSNYILRTEPLSDSLRNYYRQFYSEQLKAKLHNRGKASIFFILHVPRNLQCEFLNGLLLRAIKIFHIFKAVLHHLNTISFTLMNEFEQENKLTFRPCGRHEPLRAFNSPRNIRFFYVSLTSLNLFPVTEKARLLNVNK